MGTGFFQTWRKGASFPERRFVPWIEIEELSREGIAVGDTVELKASQTQSSLLDLDDEYDNDTSLKRDFFRIVSLFKNEQNGDVLLRGYRFRRFGLIEHHFPLGKANEVVLLADSSEEDNSNPLIQTLRDICLTDVLRNGRDRCVKRDLVITNAQFPDFSFRDPNRAETYYQHLDPRCSKTSDQQVEVRSYIAPKLVLVCRWVVEHDKPAKTIAFRRITREYADQGCHVQDVDTAKAWLHKGRRENENYIFWDVFCGAGGVSQGAHEAGLKVSLGLDSNQDALETWKRNFSEAESICMDICEYIQMLKQLSPAELSSLTVHVLHLSPPCQAFSPANARAFLKDPSSVGGINDDNNSAAMYCVEELLKLLRPRIVTMEETSGLKSHHEQFYKDLTRFFTSAGYSVATKIVDMVEYGLPMARKRLILIASCPGCALPPFPERTHSKPDQYTTNAQGKTLPRPRTPNEVLRRPVPNGNRPFTQTITTAGTPAGKFASADLQALMGFPASFSFPPALRETARIKQIGNAVPPTYTRLLFDAVKRALLAEDHAWAAARLTTWTLQDDGSWREERRRRAELPRGASAPRAARRVASCEVLGVRSSARASLPARTQPALKESALKEDGQSLRPSKRRLSDESLTEDESGRRRKAIQGRRKVESGSQHSPIVVIDDD